MHQEAVRKPGAAPLVGTIVGIALVLVAAVALVPFRDDISRADPALVLVLPVLAAAVVGGRRAALTTALAATVAFNVAFIPPFGTLKVDVAEDALALAVFLLVAVVGGTVVAWEADRRSAAEQRTLEVEALNRRLEDIAAERERLAEETTRLAVLERLDEQRSALLRSVSHDLRTPLATIRAVASDLRDGAVHDVATRNELLDTVGDEAERLDRLVANLLSMSRIEAGALAPDRQAVDVAELVADRLRGLARPLRHVEVRTDIPDDLPLVDGDYALVDQVLTNLLENAARHAPEGSTVWVAARPEGSDRVRIEVADQGRGVDEAEAAVIFEPFRRGSGSASSGVGLAICAAVVHAHGGDISVERTWGGGATFVVTFPVRLP